MKTIKNLTAILILMMVLISCNQQQSLQQYMVDKRDTGEFISLDIPKSLFKFDSLGLDAEQQSALESVNKVNLLALKYDDSLKALYETEKETINQILKSENYKELARFKWDNINMILTYEGDENAVDEMIIFGSDNTKGFLLLRVLGKNMQPAQMTQLAFALKGVDDSNPAFNNLKGIFNSQNIK